MASYRNLMLQGKGIGILENKESKTAPEQPDNVTDPQATLKLPIQLAVDPVILVSLACGPCSRKQRRRRRTMVNCRQNNGFAPSHHYPLICTFVF